MVGAGPSLESFRGLAEVLRGEQGPLRVLWIGRSFAWAAPPYRPADPLAGTPPQAQIPFDSPFALLDAFTQAGVDLWPMVWLDGQHEPDQNLRLDLHPASDLARYLGGQANVCVSDLAGCLKSALEASSHDAWIIRIAGPQVDWTNGAAKLLHLWYAPNRAVLDLKRPFVRLNQPKAWTLKRRVGLKRLLPLRGTPPSVPLFDSMSLPGKAGCDAGTGSELPKPAMTAIVPDAFVPGLRAHVEALGEQTQFRTRSTPKPVLLRETGQGAAEICVDLPSTSQTNANYRIVVFNPEAGWAGVGFLPVADVLRSH